MEKVELLLMGVNVIRCNQCEKSMAEQYLKKLNLKPYDSAILLLIIDLKELKTESLNRYSV